MFFTDSTLSRRRAGLHTDAVSLATSVTRDGPDREERRHDGGNADEDGADCWADLPTPISTAARTASAASGSIRREVPHDLVVRCDNDGYRGVVRGDEKCARQDWIEAAPNLATRNKAGDVISVWAVLQTIASSDSFPTPPSRTTTAREERICSARAEKFSHHQSWS